MAGGLLQGRRDKVPPHFLAAITKYNLAFISADYRLAPQVGVADIFEDVDDCVKFIRSPQGLIKHVDPKALDTSRLAVSGGSAGGYLAFLAGLYVEPKPQVIMPIYPITDPLGTFFITPQPNPQGRIESATVAPFMEPEGEVVANNDPLSARTQSYFWMMQECNLASLLKIPPERGSTQDHWRVSRSIRENRLPPSYVAHGDADHYVGVEQSDEAIGVMVGEGLEFAFERRHDADHLFDMSAKEDMQRMYEFTMKYL